MTTKADIDCGANISLLRSCFFSISFTRNILLLRSIGFGKSSRLRWQIPFFQVVPTELQLSRDEMFVEQNTKTKSNAVGVT